MGRAQHRGTHAGTGAGRRTRPVVLVAVALVLVAVVFALGLRALADAGDDTETATTFTGVVTRLGDGGSLLCVQRPGASDAEFCDVFYTPPDAAQVQVGDSVVVTTITSLDADGSPVSGMLVEPVP